ncbi:uncharacterized protein MICPUCDRAFT_57905 [Micromonas pusilla CCMP1545]|uniref:Predicted protein n=1 Tax=Micromonas pusilla (strain CCMP1545) TaxID=564608 RepID=C1MT16_MICPC|nr:uncharacterized protein MICPUCDRAFT_57905 [Micromonas pusilla CCMP1545]EEH56871.1 predicted protein [Micromonas pusilla CCMP1545]|eukprot:XP_003058416.1 predicted protein [Micromonas pusilla CCMP1545]
MTGEKSMLPSADDVIANAGAFGQQLGLGALAGYVSGRFARAGATVGLALCGGAFVALQTLQYGGYVRVDWHKVEREARRAMDANGDGALTADDAKLAWGEVVDVLAFGVPSGAGFGLGLAHGVGLPGANLLAGGALFAAAPALCGAHLFQTSDGFRETLEKAAPMLSRELTRAVDAAKTRAEAAAGDARCVLLHTGPRATASAR